MFYVLVGIIILLIFVYRKILNPARYWQERDVVHVKAWPIIGSMGDFITRKKHFSTVMMDIYNQYPNERCVGYMCFTSPHLMIRDLDLIKRITIRDFEHFHDHLTFQNIKTEPLLSKSLISLTGENWRRMRATLSPVFTSNKLRTMYQLMTDCGENFVKHLAQKDRHEVEMKELLSKFANDVIATTVFGVRVDSLADPDNDFFKMGTKFTNIGFWTFIKALVMRVAPKLANLLQIQVFAEGVTSFFRSLVKDNMEERERGGIVRPDLIHLLMEARKGQLKHETIKEVCDSFAAVEEYQVIKDTSSHVEFTDDHFVAQTFLFFLGGFDTVSTSSSFLAHELAIHPEIQKKLQNEIDAVIEEYLGKVPYQALLSMKYLDQVVCETLRLWNSNFFTDRLCTKDYVIEPIYPKEKVVFVAKGTTVTIPIGAIHRDPQYFSDPNKFDSERFSDENKQNIVPGSYLPFGVGPRSCIGSRFALVELKILFFHLLSTFIIVPVDETAIPIKIDPRKMHLTPENGFRMGLRRRPINVV